MNFTFPSCVGGLAAALQTYSTETNAANAASPTIDDVCDILRNSFPRSYLVSYKKAEKLNNISTAVQSQNLQARVLTTAFNDAKGALMRKVKREWRNDDGPKDVTKIVDKYGAFTLVMAIEHAGLLERLLDKEEDDEVWKQVSEMAWERHHRGIDMKNMNMSNNKKGKKYKHALNERFRCALAAAEHKKVAEGGLLEKGKSYAIWFTYLAPELESRMGADVVKRHVVFMTNVRAGMRGAVRGDASTSAALASEGAMRVEDDGLGGVLELLKSAGVDEDEVWAFNRMCRVERVLKLEDIFTLGDGLVSGMVKSGVYGDGLSLPRLETMKSGSGVIKSEKGNGKRLEWATELIRLQGNGAKVAGPMYWTRLNPTGGGKAGKQEKTWQRYTKVLGCLLAWLIEELKVPTLVDLPSGISEMEDNLATAWLQLIHR